MLSTPKTFAVVLDCFKLFPHKFCITIKFFEQFNIDIDALIAPDFICYKLTNLGKWSMFNSGAEHESPFYKQTDLPQHTGL